MTLKEVLIKDLKNSMKNKDTVRKNTITMIRASIQQLEIDNKTDLSEDDIISVINKELKERRHSLDEFKKANRTDLVQKTEKEINVLLEYLPEQLSDSELKNIVIATIKEVEAESKKDIGRIMGKVMPKIKGRADGSKVNSIINEYFK